MRISISASVRIFFASSSEKSTPAPFSQTRIAPAAETNSTFTFSTSTSAPL
jgi:hypothetical protein